MINKETSNPECMCGLQSDIVEIKRTLKKLNKKLDRLLEERETAVAMTLRTFPEILSRKGARHILIERC